jgi:DNA-binding MarR family transcriptional regulator
MPPRLSAKSRSIRVDKSTSETAQAEHLARVFRLEDKPGFLLRRLDARATLLYHKVTGQTDLTPRQFGVLLTLFQNEHITLTDLSQRIRIDKSTLGEMVQRMIDRGLVRRRLSVADRRSSEVSLSAAGRVALLATVRQAEAAQQALLEPLPDEYRSLFLKCLGILADADQDSLDAAQG